jgi:MinD superfamily P-loop ATPase
MMEFGQWGRFHGRSTYHLVDADDCTLCGRGKVYCRLGYINGSKETPTKEKQCKQCKMKIP